MGYEDDGSALNELTKGELIALVKRRIRSEEEIGLDYYNRFGYYPE